MLLSTDSVRSVSGSLIISEFWVTTCNELSNSAFGESSKFSRYLSLVDLATLLFGKTNYCYLFAVLLATMDNRQLV